jgi:hypothetical protein
MIRKQERLGVLLCLGRHTSKDLKLDSRPHLSRFHHLLIVPPAGHQTFITWAFKTFQQQTTIVTFPLKGDKELNRRKVLHHILQMEREENFMFECYLKIPCSISQNQSKIVLPNTVIKIKLPLLLLTNLCPFLCRLHILQLIVLHVQTVLK